MRRLVLKNCTDVPLTGDEYPVRSSSLSLSIYISTVPETMALENPFVRQLQTSPYLRFIENGHPFVMLAEVMRSTNGLEEMGSELFYDNQLKPGIGTELSHESRVMSRVWTEKIHARYPSLTPPPADKVYPVFITITTTSEPELQGGTSRINNYNIAFVIDHIVWVLESAIATTADIGIAAPYAAQVNTYRETLTKLKTDKPDYDWSRIRIGTTEWWQGNEADYIVIDLVRGNNDHAELGFMSDARRLNVLVSRMKMALVIVGDKDCTVPAVTGNQRDDKNKADDSTRKNKKVIAMFDFLKRNGRTVEVLQESLSEKYVSFKAADPARSLPAAEPNDSWESAPAGSWDTAATTSYKKVSTPASNGEWDGSISKVVTKSGW